MRKYSSIVSTLSALHSNKCLFQEVKALETSVFVTAVFFFPALIVRERLWRRTLRRPIGKGWVDLFLRFITALECLPVVLRKALSCLALSLLYSVLKEKNFISLSFLLVKITSWLSAFQLKCSSRFDQLWKSLASIIVSRLRKMDLASVIHHLKDERTRLLEKE